MFSRLYHGERQTSSGKGCRHRSIIFAASLTLLAGQAAAETSSQLPVDLVNGSKVEVRGAYAERNESGVRARGWVKRKLGHFGPIRSHLHIEGLNAQGATLNLIETQWRGNLPSRPGALAPFSANFAPYTGDEITRVRISVQPGVRHDAKE